MMSTLKANNNQQILLISTALTAVVVTSQYKRIYRAFSTIAHRVYLNLVVLTQKEALAPPPTKEGTGAGTVTQLYIHPVKSLKAISVDEALLVERGFENDRRFMIVTPAPTPIYGSFGPKDATHRFMTQRQCPSLATVTARLEKSTLTLSSPVLPNQVVTISTTPSPNAPIYRSTLWGDIVSVQDLGDEASSFLTQLVSTDSEVPDELKSNVRLVVQTTDDTRTADDAFVPAATRTVLGQKNPTVSLTDGFPLLIACEASLQELNRRLIEKGKAELPMSRFRPNIVIQGTKPFEEDDWKVIRIGSVILHVVKPCPRCKQSCTDQTTGVVTEEPLETLADFRALDCKNPLNRYFAQNAIPDPGSIGQTIAVGATVEVLEWGDPIYTD